MFSLSPTNVCKLGTHPTDFLIRDQLHLGRSCRNFVINFFASFFFQQVFIFYWNTTFLRIYFKLKKRKLFDFGLSSFHDLCQIWYNFRVFYSWLILLSFSKIFDSMFTMQDTEKLNFVNAHQLH